MRVKEIHAAYTSQIGEMKYAKPYGLSQHEAAAYVIARRGEGYEERVPKGIVKEMPVLVEELREEVVGAREAARACPELSRRERLRSQLEVLENWKRYSPEETNHRWKLWRVVNELKSPRGPKVPKEGIIGVRSG
jgi:hypothetical protein